jgi:transposase-like protein
MRQRVIDRVESGASRREAAEHYEVSPSTAVIWVKCFRETGRCAAKPRGGSTSPLEKHADFLLAPPSDSGIGEAASIFVLSSLASALNCKCRPSVGDARPPD